MTRDDTKNGGSADVSHEQDLSPNNGAPIRIEYDSNTSSMNTALGAEPI